MLTYSMDFLKQNYSKQLFLMIFLFLFFAFYGIVKADEAFLKTAVVIEEVESCKSLLKKDSPRVQVCGRCVIIFETSEKRLMITETNRCMPYDVYECSTTAGDVFIINTLSCRSLIKN